MKNIKVYQNSERLKNMIIAFSIIIIVLLYFISNQCINLYRSFSYNYLYLESISMFLELFILIIVSVLLIRLLINLKMKKPFLIFSEEKIVSNGLISTSELYWNEVEYHTYTSLNDVFFLVLKLRPDSNFKTRSSYFRKFLNNYNLNRVGGEVAFAAIFLMDDFESVNKLISLKTKRG